MKNNSINKGGSAFPFSEMVISEDMSLRDYYAAHAPKVPRWVQPLMAEKPDNKTQVQSKQSTNYLKEIIPFHCKGNRVFFFKLEVLKSLEQLLNDRKEERRCRF